MFFFGQKIINKTPNFSLGEKKNFPFTFKCYSLFFRGLLYILSFNNNSQPAGAHFLPKRERQKALKKIFLLQGGYHILLPVFLFKFSLSHKAYHNILVPYFFIGSETGETTFCQHTLLFVFVTKESNTRAITLEGFGGGGLSRFSVLPVITNHNKGTKTPPPPPTL